MRIFQDTFETSKRLLISAFSIYMTVPLMSFSGRNIAFILFASISFCVMSLKRGKFGLHHTFLVYYQQ